MRHAGWAMAGVLLAMFAAFALNVGRPSPDRAMEKICMATSQETWIRQRGGEIAAWKTPTIAGGQLRIRKPPLLVWLNLAAWSDLDPETAQVDELAFRARLVTLALVLIGIASVGWVGWMFAGAKGGILSALIAGTMFLVVKYSHYTTYDPHLMGWTALCVACAVWAMQPVNGERRRRYHWWGWLGAGLALGGAVMTKGPVSLVYALLPLAWIVAFTREGRWRNVLGLGAMLAIAALVCSWWYWHVFHFSQTALTALRDEYSGTDEAQHRPIYQYLLVIGLVFPWTFWWAAGLVQPLVSKPWRQERRLWLAWGWFVTSFVAVLLWPMRIDRYLVPIMPGAALLTAMWLLAPMQRHREIPRWARRCWNGLWIACGIVSLGLPSFILLQPILLAQGRLQQEYLAPVAWPVTVAAALGLAGLACFGWHSISRRRLFAGGVALGLWMVLLTGIGNHCYNRAARLVPGYATDATRVFEATRGMPVYYLAKERAVQPKHGFRIYSRRCIRPLDADKARQLSAAGSPFAVLAVADSAESKLLTEMGLAARLAARDKEITWVLYQPVTGSVAH